ncbi:hypothetical protein O181_021113 [Austropuccinia psidii MF-1]|uniref:Integrase catalytic domain-containing protein n=1 Tax=Austropuccinia psidii MF-1 TaxID=1389203 RepID=A0A9Q3CCQ4_9BASI|nr:hypothetical protein [Austropuccinia psidii MF-1]
MSSNPDNSRYPTRSQQKLTSEQPDISLPEAVPSEYAKDVGPIINRGINIIKQEHILRDDRTERICRAILLSSLPDCIQDRVITLRPCSAIYGWLKSHYFIVTRSTQCASFDKLFSIEINNNEPPSSLVMRLNEALTEFKNRGGVFNDGYILGQLLQRAIIKRPTIYRSVMDKLDGDASDPKQSNISLDPSSASPHPTDVASHTALRTSMSITCHLCQRRGHMAKECPNTKDGNRLRPQNTTPSMKPIITPAQYQAHYPIITPPTQIPFHASQQTFSNTFKQQRFADLYRPQYPLQTPPALKAKFAEIGPSDSVVEEVTIDDMAPPGDRRSVCDTGASHSLTGELSSLCRFKKLTSPIPLCVATRTTRRSFVTGVGSLVYPGYRGALVNAGASLDFIGDDILINTREDGPVLRAEYSASGCKWELPLYSRLLARAIDYSIPPTKSPTESIETISVPTFSAVTIESKKIATKENRAIRTDPLAFKNELFKWHCLFGHTGLRRIRRLLGDSAPDYLRYSTHDIHDCDECLKSKSLRHSDLHSLNRSPSPLEIVVADLMGPFDVETINGGRYALNIRDVASTYGKCHILKNKSDATCRLEETINRWQRASGYPVKILRTDNGGEFNNATMNTWLQQQGITHERSLPFFHQQNGVAERYNRTIADMGRTILLGSKLPKAFWGHAFMWAAYTNNILPNLHTGRKTPTEILFKITPQIDRMRIFGETAFIHIPQEKRRKLDDRAVKGVAVMHLPNSKGRLFFIPDQAKFISSAWATFPASASLIKTLVRPAVPTRKGDVAFIMNELTLGDFSAERTVEAQDQASGCVANESFRPPKSYAEAMKRPDSLAWRRAIDQEIENMKQHAVFEITPLPSNIKPIGGGWVFVKKPASKDCEARYKARYVARGNSQLSGCDFHETFAPTATFTSLRLLLTAAARQNWHTSSFDFIAAYLNAPIDEELWIRPPEGLTIPKGHGCKLWKALYGTRQAGRCWWTHLRKSLETRGYSLSSYDTSVFFNKSTNIIIWLHVDDGVVFGKSKGDIDDLHLSLSAEFGLKWSPELGSIVGLDIHRDAHGFHLSQVRLIQSILADHWDRKADYESPLPAKCDLLTLTDQDETMQQQDFLSAVGALSYAVTGTRPDLAYAVNLLARYSLRPGAAHWRCLQHLLGYLNKTQHYCLSLSPKPDNSELVIYSDASWGGEFSRSSHGCHAEFMALAMAARHGQWLQHLLLDVLSLKYVIQLRCDNASCIKIAKDCSSNKRTQHSDRDFFFTNQLLYNGSASIQWVPSSEMLADGFTKPLSPLLHKRLLHHFFNKPFF